LTDLKNPKIVVYTLLRKWSQFERSAKIGRRHYDVTEYL